MAYRGAQRLAISRRRLPGTGLIGRERIVAASYYQNRPDRARRLHGDFAKKGEALYRGHILDLLVQSIPNLVRHGGCVS